MTNYDNKLIEGIASLSPEAARAQLEYLVSVGERVANAENGYKIEEIDGQKYFITRNQTEPILPEKAPCPDTFYTFSLNGLVDFIEADVDGIFSDPDVRHIVSVCDVDSVKVYSPLVGYHKTRHVIAECKARNPRIPFDSYMDPEDFQIMVQTRFKDSENRKLILKLAGNIKDEQSMQTADDGVSQKVTIKKGVSTVADLIVKNPVELTPLRTFYEVEQPSSPFVLRFSENAKVALFEGDGGAWKLEAVENIKKWLRTKLYGENVHIIA